MTQGADTTRELTPYEQLQLFSGALNQIRVNYIDTVSYRELVRAAIDGMLHALDPHSTFMTRREWERREALERGELVGVGLELEEEDSLVTVLGVVQGSPAAKAGIEPGDWIRAVNDTTIAGLKAADVALRLAGAKGSQVGLQLDRGSRLDPTRFAVLLTRDVLKPTVTISGMADPITGFARLAWFSPNAQSDLRDAVRRLQRAGAQRLVLDLRDNPGGIVQSAVEIASLFLPKGALVFRTQGRKADATKDYVSTRDGEFRDLPLIALINERSASASEALAGSLQDHDRALIIGRRSFGKALVQTAFVLMPVGDVVMLTVGRVFTPSGRLIQRRYRGIRYEQYVSFAGKSGAAEDTLTVYKTDHGRAVRGGGGIEPDISLPGSTDLPAWWSIAADSGFDVAVADSVAATLASTPASRAQWMDNADRWSPAVLTPFLGRVRARLHVTAQLDSALAQRLALHLASRVAAVRWPPDGGDELGIRNDPAIRTALTYFPTLSHLLHTSGP